MSFEGSIKSNYVQGQLVLTGQLDICTLLGMVCMHVQPTTTATQAYSLVKPPWTWRITICLTTVLLPLSPAPVEGRRVQWTRECICFYYIYLFSPSPSLSLLYVCACSVCVCACACVWPHLHTPIQVHAYHILHPFNWSWISLTPKRTYLPMYAYIPMIMSIHTLPATSSSQTTIPHPSSPRQPSTGRYALQTPLPQQPTGLPTTTSHLHSTIQHSTSSVA